MSHLGCMQVIVVATCFWDLWLRPVLGEVLSPYQTPRKSGRQFLSSRLHLTEIPTEHSVIATSTPRPPDEEAPSIPETPKFDPEGGGEPPDEPAIGLATRVDQ